MSTEHHDEQPAGGAEKYVYSFGGGKADGNGKMKDALGGKGAGLAEMTKAGLPVPLGFTIQTEACREYMRSGAASKDVSSAAVVARGMGKCCVVGAYDIEVDEKAREMRVKGQVFIAAMTMSVRTFVSLSQRVPVLGALVAPQYY